jgi:hypothetical protein
MPLDWPSPGIQGRRDVAAGPGRTREAGDDAGERDNEAGGSGAAVQRNRTWCRTGAGGRGARGYPWPGGRSGGERGSGGCPSECGGPGGPADRSDPGGFDAGSGSVRGDGDIDRGVAGVHACYARGCGAELDGERCRGVAACDSDGKRTGPKRTCVTNGHHAEALRHGGSRADGGCRGSAPSDRPAHAVGVKARRQWGEVEVRPRAAASTGSDGVNPEHASAAGPHGCASAVGIVR